ncbi:hypothetical protein Btru_043810 [Bulinus truncatus]|nr:hypothetical protein Btru_043810 [Bulinus truncatus]
MYNITTTITKEVNCNTTKAAQKFEMNQLIAVCVLAVVTTANVVAECGLSRASKVTKERQFQKLINIDKRNFTEYHVTYRNFSKDLPAFNRTNTDRLQPWRWFNVHEEAINELKMVYDSNLFLFRGLFDIQTVYLETVVEPLECLHTLNAEELENLTRKFLLNDKELMNPMVCSPHIYNNNGTGAIRMRCYELTPTGEIRFTETDEGKTLLALHIFAVFGSVVMIIVLFFSWNLIDLGSEDFFYYPEDMTVQVSESIVTNQQNNDRNQTEIAARTVKISNRIKGLAELKQTLQGSTHDKQYKIGKIKLSVNKRKCIGNGKLCISFLRCIKEPLNDVTNCYCKSCNKTRTCCCKPCGCISRCINVNAGAVCMILILLSCAVPLVPLIVHLQDSNDNSPSVVNFIKCCRELILVINRPLVFNRSRDEKLLSKRFISQMYSKTSDCMACELNHYAKALLFALIPCFALLVIFFLFLNFGTLYSYSTDLTGYMAITVTFMPFFNSIAGKAKGAYMLTEVSEDWFKREIKDRLLNYGESWTVSDIELIPLPDVFVYFAMVKGKLLRNLHTLINLRSNSPFVYEIVKDSVLLAFSEPKPLFEESEKAEAAKLVKTALRLLEKYFALLHG